MSSCSYGRPRRSCREPSPWGRGSYPPYPPPPRAVRPPPITQWAGKYFRANLTSSSRGPNTQLNELLVYKVEQIEAPTDAVFHDSCQNVRQLQQGLAVTLQHRDGLNST